MRNEVRTHPPSFTFWMARSTAGCRMPLPRKVSMTCPFRKKAEDTLESFHEASTLLKYPEGNLTGW